MSKPKLSPWFNAKTQPPVNGKPSDLYEFRCQVHGTKPAMIPKWNLTWACDKCEWRGVMK